MINIKYGLYVLLIIHTAVFICTLSTFGFVKMLYLFGKLRHVTSIMVKLWELAIF